nr:unnamed protein product [Spirometra erinaceieuropaei]
MALHSSVQQMQATLSDVVNALQRASSAGSATSSSLNLPLCTEEAYENFLRRLSVEDGFANEAVCAHLLDCFQVRQLAMVGGRNEADFLRNLLTVLLGPPLCHNFCWAGGSKEKKSFMACPLFSVLKDAIAQHPRFGNCTTEIFRRTAIRWFHGSQDRYGGRSTRRRSVRQTAEITTPAATCPQLSPAKETPPPSKGKPHQGIDSDSEGPPLSELDTPYTEKASCCCTTRRAPTSAGPPRTPTHAYRTDYDDLGDTVRLLCTQSKAKPIELPPAAHSAFEAAKKALADATLLQHLSSDPHAQLILTTDASNSAVGAVLHQQKLQPAQTRYSTFSRELLAIYLAIRHFRHLLEGRDFSVHTDHKPLTYALKAKTDRYSPREVRHLDYISQFIADIRYVRGSDTVVADALSRPRINTHIRFRPGEACRPPNSRRVHRGLNYVYYSAASPASTANTNIASTFVQQLKQRMAQLSPTPTRLTSKHVFVHEDLKAAHFVFVQHDAVHKSLCSPYYGPYKALQRMDKYYVIQKADKTDTVSIDRLKPAYVECIPPSAVPPTSSVPSSPAPPVLVPSTQPPHSTTTPTRPDSSSTLPRTSSRSGIHINFPAQLKDFLM